MLALPVKGATVEPLGEEATLAVVEAAEPEPRVSVGVVPAIALIVELRKDEMLAVELEIGAMVGAAQVTHATLVETVIGITAVHGQSVIVTVVASVMVEVREPWVRTVGPGQ